jgi:hypothetical protein
MNYSRTIRVLACAAAMLAAGQVHAQATRTWVSGVGDDANPCSRTAPCKTFAGAISKTADGGEIDTLDPGGFGPVTITKSITLANDGAGTAGLLASGTTGVLVNAPAGSTIYLRNLIIDGGSASANSVAGVRVLSGDVHIDGCVIRGFVGNPGAGIAAIADTNASRVFVTNTKIYGNRIGVMSTALVSSPIALIDTVVDKNLDFGIQGTGAFATFSLSNTVVTGTTVGISAPAPAKVNSYGNNMLSGTFAAGTTLTPVALR